MTPNEFTTFDLSLFPFTLLRCKHVYAVKANWSITTP